MEKSYRELCAEIEALQQQAAVARANEVANAVAEVKRIISEFKLTAADCGFAGSKVTSAVKTGKPVPVKFRHPDDASLTWSGRGKAPKWLSTLESEGRKREEFRV